MCGLLLAITAVLLDARALFRSDVAVGIDGYYYVLQIETFLREGRFYFPTSTPVVLWLLSGLAALTGDSIQALKTGAILLQTGVCLGIFALLVTISRRVWIALIGMSISVFSGIHNYFIGEFISSLGSLVFLVWSAATFIKYWQTRRTLWLLPAVILSVCSLFSHRAAVGVIAATIVSIVFSIALLHAKRSRGFGVVVLLILVLMLLLALYWQTLFPLPVTLKREILPHPENPLRYLVLPESLMIFFSAFLGCFCLLRSSEQTNLAKMTTFLAVLIWSCLITFNPFLNHQTGFYGIVGRLDALVYIQAAIAVPLSLTLFKPSSHLGNVLVLAPFAILLAWSFLMPMPIGLQKEYLDERATLIAQLKAVKIEFCENPIVIAPHGKQFVVASILGVPSQQRRPIKNIYQCTYWLIQSRSSGEEVRFSVVEESEVDAMIHEENSERNNELLMFNPHLTHFY